MENTHTHTIFIDKIYNIGLQKYIIYITVVIHKVLNKSCRHYIPQSLNRNTFIFGGVLILFYFQTLFCNFCNIKAINNKQDKIITFYL